MLVTILSALSWLCFALAVPALLWPRRFSPCAPAYRHRRLLGALIWLSFGFMLRCWFKLMQGYALFGWCTQMAILTPMAVLVTGFTLWNFWRVQK